MMRTFNILAIATLIGSATAAYSVKYETILVAEKLKKRESELQREKDAIAVLKAEWEMLNRPARLQALAPLEPGMQMLSVRQIVRARDIPARVAEKDPLDGMLTGAIAAPARNAPRAGAPTPAALPRQATRTTPAPRSSAATPQPRAVIAPKQTVPRAAQGAPLALRPPAPIGMMRAPVPLATPSATPIPRRNISPPQR